MEERTGIVTFKGNPVTLLGPALKVGDKAPDFHVVDATLAPVTLADSRGKTRIVSAVPSIDTPVCDTETRRFNEEAAKLPRRHSRPDDQPGSPLRPEALVRRRRNRSGHAPVRLPGALLRAWPTAC